MHLIISCFLCNHMIHTALYYLQGTSLALSAHNSKDVSEHLVLVQRAMEHREMSRTKELRALKDEVQSLKHDIASYKESFDKLRNKLLSRVDHTVQAVVKVESAIRQLQDGFGEMALLVQTLQATSYGGVFVWKIPEVKRRRQEAKMGRTISLYSAPFYTSRHGYKLCLRLYMDGDGSGKGSHLSFFLTIMRGEFDSLLQWPFKQTVSLMLLDQDRQRDIIQSFRPEPSSASFQRPRMEMNVASGCPNFAPLSVLDNPSYVKEDTMFLKCVIDRTGLENT